MYTTFLASAFRSIRFGVNEAHGRGQAIQLNYLLDQGAFKVNADGTFSVDAAKIRDSVTALTREIMTLQAEGSYAEGPGDDRQAGRRSARNPARRSNGSPTCRSTSSRASPLPSSCCRGARSAAHTTVAHWCGLPAAVATSAHSSRLKRATHVVQILAPALLNRKARRGLPQTSRLSGDRPARRRVPPFCNKSKAGRCEGLVDFHFALLCTRDSRQRHASTGTLDCRSTFSSSTRRRSARCLRGPACPSRRDRPRIP